jgi:hypothetical protein
MRRGKGKIHRIVVRSELDERYASAFEGMRMETKDGQTILSGRSKTSRTSTGSSTA